VTDTHAGRVRVHRTTGHLAEGRELIYLDDSRPRASTSLREHAPRRGRTRRRRVGVAAPIVDLGQVALIHARRITDGAS
jgi:hypothetical protein